MVLQNLTLQNFRNFGKKSFEFSSGLTVIAGPNTVGKTNLLEAIYLLANGKSFKAEREAEMIGYGEEIARIKSDLKWDVGNKQSFSANGKLDKEVRNEKLEITPQKIPLQNPASHVSPPTSNLEVILTVGQVGNQSVPLKKYLVNGVSRRQIDFVGNLRAVLFWPEDLELITDSPSLRRKYLDMVLCQVDREYRRSLSAYEKGVRQRNRLLERIRDEGANRAQLTFWNQLLIKNGNILTEKRQEFIEFVNNFQFSMTNFQSKSNFQFSIEYDKSLISEARLLQYANEEIASVQTLVGPQRDDFRILIHPNKITPNESESRDLALYGSRGEQRMAILWLKLAELEFIVQATGERPILLLDDIFSELDEAHRDLVLEIIPHQQTIMTTTDLGLIEEKFFKSAKIIEL